VPCHPPEVADRRRAHAARRARLGDDQPGTVLAKSDRSVIVESGAALIHHPTAGGRGAGASAVGPIDAGPVAIRLAQGDTLRLTGPDVRSA